MNYSHMPRLGPFNIRRNALEEWLARFKDVPVRFLIAPPGFGKTLALLSYLHCLKTPGIYCAVSASSDMEAFWQALGKALGVEAGPRSYDELRAMLSARAPMELAFDFEDVPCDEAAAVLRRLMCDLPVDVSLLIACRSRAPFDVTHLVNDGTAVLCDAERLAFDANEIRQLAEICSVPFKQTDVHRLIEATDGWPQVVSGAIRKATEDSCDLAHAYDNWRTHRGHLFHEFVAARSEHVSILENNLMQQIMAGSRVDDRTQLQMLEEQGLFVIHTPAGYRPLRALSHRGLGDRYAERASSVLPMHVRLFGWFSAEIDRRQVEWVRRRDRQIFEYVALQANGRASRADVSATFWPDGDKALAGQSLRTACSGIRRAIANIVGIDLVDAYFKTGDDISIDLNNVVVDVNRFIANADEGDVQYRRGQRRAAAGHYRRAASIHRDDLLIADSHEPWVRTPNAAFERRNAELLKRMAEFATPDGEQFDLAAGAAAVA